MNKDERQELKELRISALAMEYKIQSLKQECQALTNDRDAQATQAARSAFEWGQRLGEVLKERDAARAERDALAARPALHRLIAYIEDHPDFLDELKKGVGL